MVSAFGKMRLLSLLFHVKFSKFVTKVLRSNAVYCMRVKMQSPLGSYIVGGNVTANLILINGVSARWRVLFGCDVVMTSAVMRAKPRGRLEYLVVLRV